MATPREVHKYQCLSGEAPADGSHDNPSPLTSDLLRNESKIQSWPRKSERKSAGGEMMVLPGNVFSLLERTLRQKWPFPFLWILCLSVMFWTKHLSFIIPTCGETRNDTCKSPGHSIHSVSCSYYCFYYSNELTLWKPKFSVIHAWKWYNSASSLKGRRQFLRPHTHIPLLTSKDGAYFLSLWMRAGLATALINRL